MTADGARRVAVTETLTVDAGYAGTIAGLGDQNLRELEQRTGVRIFLRGDEVTVSGEPGRVEHACAALRELESMARRSLIVNPATVKQALVLVTPQRGVTPTPHTAEVRTRRGTVVRPQTAGQQRYCAAIDESTVTFGIGPAGSGKTYLAMAKAVQALGSKAVSRIILTRPAVEAGEKLGFLPGTFSDKIDPYLRPLYDALRDMLDPEEIPRLIEAGVIEVAPLAYMRGRTLNDAFVILDEAQNTTAGQMKMFLTRLGFGSTMVVTGDVTQVDLPGGATSGLRVASEVLKGVEGISIVQLTSDDVVRHHLVGEIVAAYDRWNATHDDRHTHSQRRQTTARMTR